MLDGCFYSKATNGSGRFTIGTLLDLVGEAIRTGGAAFCFMSSDRVICNVFGLVLTGEGNRTGREAFCTEVTVCSVASRFSAVHDGLMGETIRTGRAAF